MSLRAGFSLVMAITLGCWTGPARGDDSPAATTPLIGVHVGVGGRDALDKLGAQVPAIAKMGVNALVVEVNYAFDFQSRPEMADPNGVTKEQAGAFAKLCRDHGVRVIPSLNCLGHQSWAKHTAALLTKHPEFDETPGKYPNNEGIYCRSWCPLHPDLNGVVFALIDELIDAFEADAFHVGMDEVFIIADDDCPRCKGKDPAELFAKAVNDLHGHLVDGRKVEMLMWGDRLLDSKTLAYGRWEASDNGTAPAADKIPKDIIMCDWHYETKPADYPSVPFLLEKGFRVWPAGWHNVEAVAGLIDVAIAQKNPRMIGYLNTTWGRVPLDRLETFPPIKLSIEKFQAAAKPSGD